MFELQHIIVSAMPVADQKFNWFWCLGSLIPDIDHLFVLYRHKIFSFQRAMEVMKNEDKYNLRFKTKYLHSIFGAVVLSLPVWLINHQGGVYFFIAYIVHLCMDLVDRDEKQYFYPFKLKVRGWLPILSKWEILFTIVLSVILIFLYK